MNNQTKPHKIEIPEILRILDSILVQDKKLRNEKDRARRWYFRLGGAKRGAFFIPTATQPLKPVGRGTNLTPKKKKRRK